MGFVAGHAFGNGVACWVIISEIYPAKVRGRAMSIATTALWVVGYLGNQLFPSMMKHVKASGTFLGLCQRGGFDNPLCVFRNQRTNPGANHPVLDITARRSDTGTSSIDIASER